MLNHYSYDKKGKWWYTESSDDSFSKVIEQKVADNGSIDSIWFKIEVESQINGPKDKPNHLTRNNLNGTIALAKTSKQKFGQVSGEFWLSRGRVADESLQSSFGWVTAEL